MARTFSNRGITRGIDYMPRESRHRGRVTTRKVVAGLLRDPESDDFIPSYKLGTWYEGARWTRHDVATASRRSGRKILRINGRVIKDVPAVRPSRHNFKDGLDGENAHDMTVYGRTFNK